MALKNDLPLERAFDFSGNGWHRLQMDLRQARELFRSLRVTAPPYTLFFDMSRAGTDTTAIRVERSMGMAALTQPIRFELVSTEPSDPLPPLEDLDEGLTCDLCQASYDTFAAYLAHRRRCGEG